MGRLSRTHSKEITWAEFLDEALGDMGLHPWELWEYTWEEFRAKRKGQRAREQRIYQQTRQLAYCVLLPYLDKKARKKPLDEIVPDMYEKAIDKPKKTYAEIMAPYIKAGVIKENAR